MRILAIDPGYERMGIAILEHNHGKKDILLHSECLQTSAKLQFCERLRILGSEVENCAKKWSPDMLAIETLFYNTNQKTAMRVSEARGAIIYEAMRCGLEIHEYTPLQIKIAVTGYGRGDKKHVIAMIPKLISIRKVIKYDDEYDAIAIGLTCIASFIIESRRIFLSK